MLDWNKESTDVIASGKYPGLADLGIKPVPVNSELALRYFLKIEALN
jgi:hypothetical protein